MLEGKVIFVYSTRCKQLLDQDAAVCKNSTLILLINRCNFIKTAFHCSLKSSAMSTLQQIHNWSLVHHPRWLVVVRVALGLSLIYKGISFMFNSVRAGQLLQNTVFDASAHAIFIGITWAHLLGGFLICIGLLTRWAVLLQMPILLAAIIILANQYGLYAAGADLPFTIVVFLLLVFFLIEGGGPLSLDNYFRLHPK
jgi:putative oxidoreductase